MNRFKTLILAGIAVCGFSSCHKQTAKHVVFETVTKIDTLEQKAYIQFITAKDQFYWFKVPPHDLFDRSRADTLTYEIVPIKYEAKPDIARLTVQPKTSFEDYSLIEYHQNKAMMIHASANEARQAGIDIQKLAQALELLSRTPCYENRPNRLNGDKIDIAITPAAR